MEGKGQGARGREGVWLWECTSPPQAARLLLCDDIRPLGEGKSRLVAQQGLQRTRHQ